MKVAVLAESELDEIICHRLVESIRGEPVDRVRLKLRDRGLDAVLRMLPPAIKHLEWQTDAAALAMLVDSDLSPPHTRGACAATVDCRLCQALRAIEGAQQQLNRRPRVKAAVGLAVPSIEAWLLVGQHETGEAAWRSLLGHDLSRAQSQRVALKSQCYPTPRRPLTDEEREQLAARLAAEIGSLERKFPDGFGSFADAVRKW